MENSETTISKRVFVGIKVTSEIASACKKLQHEIARLPVRMVRPSNIHLTLLPPWKMEDQALTEKRLEQVVPFVKSFKLQLEHIRCWPPHRQSRLVCIECLPNEDLLFLRKRLFEVFQIEDDPRPFIPHITIARFNKKEGKRHYRIDKAIRLPMQVHSVQLFEVLPTGGDYQILTSLFLRKGDR
jgi:2'-5' RNA ligase